MVSVHEREMRERSGRRISHLGLNNGVFITLVRKFCLLQIPGGWL